MAMVRADGSRGAVASEIRAWLDVAVGAARKAGDVLADADTSAAASTSVVASGRDVKLAADRESERIVIDHLRARSPFGVLSEEAGEIAGEGPYRWVVDPLDGTANYWRGLPLCCVSIALVDGDEPIAGVIHEFNRRELFLGIVGAGASMNGREVRVRDVATPADAVLCTGFPVATDFSVEAVTSFVGAVRAFKKVRMLGSAALSLAYVAAGRADAYFERDIRFWDVAAGLAIVRAAGGQVRRSPSPAAEHAMTVFAGAPALASTWT